MLAMPKLLVRLKEKARALKRETTALWFALRDPRTPWPARVVGAIDRKSVV